MSGAGWFADIDPEADPRYRWQPCLDTDSGIISSFQTWFATREECEEFIRTEVIPAAGQMVDEAVGAPCAGVALLEEGP